MIIVDCNQFIIGNVMSIMKDNIIDEEHLRYNLIKYLKEYENNYKKYGDVVLAFDSKNYWRKDFFKYYKSNRKKERDNSDVDWNQVHTLIRQFKNEFEKNLKYIVLEIDKCEADDIIAVIVQTLSKYNNLIISDDKDFFQLLRIQNTALYRPRKQELTEYGSVFPHIIEDNLREHIIRGDRSDGIPNILSEDNCLNDGIRQKAITKKFLEETSNDFNLESGKEYSDKYLRNKKLIDLTEIPQSIFHLVLTTYKTELQTQNRVNNIDYFKENNIMSLFE